MNLIDPHLSRIIFFKHDIEWYLMMFYNILKYYTIVKFLVIITNILKYIFGIAEEKVWLFSMFGSMRILN